MDHSNGKLISDLQQGKIRLEQSQSLVESHEQLLAKFVDMMGDLYWAMHKITWESDILQALDLLHYRVCQTIQAADGSVLILDEAAQELRFDIVQGQMRYQLTGFRIPADVGIARWVMESGDPVIIDQAYQDSRFFHDIDDTFIFTTRSVLCVPIMAAQTPLGVIQFLNKTDDVPFNESDMTMATVLAEVIAKGILEMRSRSAVPVYHLH